MISTVHLNLVEIMPRIQVAGLLELGLTLLEEALLLPLPTCQQ